MSQKTAQWTVFTTSFCLFTAKCIQDLIHSFFYQSTIWQTDSLLIFVLCTSCSANQNQKWHKSIFYVWWNWIIQFLKLWVKLVSLKDLCNTTTRKMSKQKQIHVYNLFKIYKSSKEGVIECSQLPVRLFSPSDKFKKLSHHFLLHFSYGIGSYDHHTKYQGVFP